MATTIRLNTIYLGDNGRAYCGRHCGVTARLTGCDLSGQPLLAIDLEVLRDHPEAADIRCEVRECSAGC